ncbi:cytochrome P450 [Glonium stellatum]|uniref:Cytochrome P450 n=1 Tax=Glonium stellatum TaxID=574774 RepID=A0A8E2EMX2_9PEZI|nr:cytochrome P450 [Glonium stellatum]
MAVCVSYYIRDTYPRLPDSIPWAGTRKELFAKLRARIRALTQGFQVLLEGYSKYNSIGKPFICPNFTGKHHVVVPKTYMPWLLDQPENILSPRPVQFDTFGLDYLYSHSAMNNNFYVEVIRRDMTRSLGSTAGLVSEELSAALDEHWGMDTEAFRDVPVYESMRAVLARAVSKVLVGLPLCRDPKYLKAVEDVTETTAKQGLAIGLVLPNFLKPMVAPIIALPYHIAIRRINKMLIPLFTKRIADWKRAQNDPAFGQEYVEPNDLAQWLLKAALKNEGPQEWDPASLSEKISIINFAGLHTTVIAITNTLFDLASSLPDKDFLGGIRCEAGAILPEDVSAWSNPAFSGLVRVDSALRESLRLNGPNARGISREVMDKKGVTLPDGLHLAQGARLSAVIASIHLDEQFYHRAEEYDAFRFLDAQSKPRAGKQSEETGKPPVKAPSMSLVTTSDTFLPFGRGKHVCPGRAFAAQELKALLALISLRYEIKPLTKRPNNMTFSEFSVPPLTATLSVRRRKLGKAD